MLDPHARPTAEQLEKLALEAGASHSDKPTRDVRSNFPLWHEITGKRAYLRKLTQAAETLYGMLQTDERIRANFGKPIHLRGRDRGKLDVLPERLKTAHRFALEVLLHSMAHALSCPVTKDRHGKETRRNFVAVPLNNDSFSKPPYKSLSRSAFRSVVYALAIFDPDKRGKPWLEYVPPYNNPETGEAKRSCVMADTPLAEWMFSQGLIFPYHPHGPSTTKSQSAMKARKAPLWVSYKSKAKGAETSYAPLDRPLHGEEEALPAINAALRRQKLACRLHGYSEYQNYYDYSKGRPRTALGGNQCLYRQFAEEDGRGGRLYGHWVQTLPSELRQRLTINGNPVSELDFGSMQLALLYSTAGVSVPAGDLYEQDGMTSSREDMKMVLTLSVGNATRRDTENAIAGKLREARRITPGLAKELYEEFWTHHEAANPHREQSLDGPWIALQNLDSRIALHILAKLLKQGITAIPVHDSFIVEQRYAELTRDAMLEVFAEYCPGTAVTIKVTPSNLFNTGSRCS